VYAGLPLALALWDRGVEVHLANLSFAPLELVPPERWLEPNVAAVTPDVAGMSRTFRSWPSSSGWLSGGCRRPCLPCVASGYGRCVPGTGISIPHWVWTRSFWSGGTDVLLRGDESRLGTPVEDIGSLAADHREVEAWQS